MLVSIVSTVLPYSLIYVWLCFKESVALMIWNNWSETVDVIFTVASYSG